jgi:uncharacterized membrane protein
MYGIWLVMYGIWLVMYGMKLVMYGFALAMYGVDKSYPQPCWGIRRLTALIDDVRF